MSDKEYQPSEKALRTRRKVFCWEPPRSLTISIAAGGDSGQPVASNATNATGCNTKSKNPHRVTTWAGARPDRPTRLEPRRKNATKPNTNHKNRRQADYIQQVSEVHHRARSRQSPRRQLLLRGLLAPGGTLYRLPYPAARGKPHPQTEGCSGPRHGSAGLTSGSRRTRAAVGQVGNHCCPN